MRSLNQQFRTITPVLLISWLLTLLGLLCAIFASTRKDVALDYLTKDPAAIMEVPFYIGFFSNFGIIVWTCAFYICLYTAYRIRDNITLRDDYYFMLASGMIVLLMTMDDLYQIHETVFPVYFKIPENAVLLTYFNIYLIYIIYFRRRILRSDFLAFVLAFFFLGLSAVIKIFPLPIPQDTFLKDAFKLFGTVTWLIYFFRTTNEILDKEKTV